MTIGSGNTYHAYAYNSDTQFETPQDILTLRSFPNAVDIGSNGRRDAWSGIVPLGSVFVEARTGWVAAASSLRRTDS